MSRYTSAIAAASLVCSILAAQPAKAQIVEMAKGIAGDFVDGVLSSGAFVANLVTPSPTNHASQQPATPARIDVEAKPACRIWRARAWNGHAWVYRRVEACG
jgi:hypothetical protein